MAQYYADIQGNRGQATRMGTKSSGMEGHIRGWDIGARVSMYHNARGEDAVCITLTSGSNGAKPGRTLGTFTASDLDPEPIEVREASCILDEEVAAIIKQNTYPSNKLTTPVGLSRDLADYFAKDNPRFDREKFLEACGYWEYE
jgi:hypothetical protein